MAVVRPFKAIRPVRDKVHLVVSRSYISYEPAALSQKLDSNPYSFIHIINPDHGQMVKSPANSPELFKRIKGKFEEFIDQGVFIKDEQAAFYLYEQANEDITFRGIVCATSAKDYESGVIKRHEHTIAAREEIFKQYLDVCDINAEPVLLTYQDEDKVTEIQDRVGQRDPVYDFSTTDRTRHRVWKIEEQAEINELTAAFGDIESLYIADGHHRSASSSRLAKDYADAPADDPHHFFMSYLIPQSQLRVLEFNRLVTDLNGLEISDFLGQLQRSFIIEQCEKAQAKPRCKGEMALYVDGCWYGMKLKESYAGLDTQLCTDVILEPILGLSDLRTDKRVGFIGGQEGLDGIERKVNRGKYVLGLALFPVSITELKQVADNNEVMPPKSTWIEPKLRSGLTVYSLSSS
jgi:uncharacterized protein (DUF1015 family)